MATSEYLQVFSEQLLATQPCARCIGGNLKKKKSYSLSSSKGERSQGWVGQGESKASHQRSLSKEFAKSQFSFGNVVLTALLGESGPATGLMIESPG